MSIEDAEHRWSTTVELDGTSYEVKWQPHAIGGQDAYEYHLDIEDADALNQELAYKVRELAIQKRIEEIWDEFRIAERGITDEVVLELVEASWDGVFVGQQWNEYFYISDVSKVLKFDTPLDAMYICQSLRRDKKLGFYGFCLVRAEDEERVRSAGEEQTGHKDLRRDDQGGWYCDYCHNVGDPQDEATADASKIPCVL